MSAICFAQKNHNFKVLGAQQLAAYKRMPDSVLFRIQQVKVKIDNCDLPGPTCYKALCSRCGQMVRDQREIIQNGEVFCKPCAQDSYFSDAR